VKKEDKKEKSKDPFETSPSKKVFQKKQKNNGE
jgi:hypothetical protein